jgi:hypothetical protein
MDRLNRQLSLNEEPLGIDGVEQQTSRASEIDNLGANETNPLANSYKANENMAGRASIEMGRDVE